MIVQYGFNTRRLFAAFVLVFLAGLASAPDTSADDEPMRLPVHSTPLVAETGDDEVRFSIEVASEAGERARGLMFREEMKDDRGMLFVFSDSRQRGFWMKDTPMALDLLFIGEDGQVRAIEAGEPLSTESIAPDVEAQFVLELKSGTAQKTGIDIGDRLRHPEIDAVAGAD